MRTIIENKELNIELWIFDKDGTLITLSGWSKIMEKRLDLIKRTYGPTAAEEVKPILGFKGNKFNLKDILYTTRDETSKACAKILKIPQEEILRLFSIADNVIKEGIFEPTQGAKTLTTTLFKQSKIAILTNDLEERTHFILRQVSIPFHLIVGADTFSFSKPDGRLVYEIMKKFNVLDPEKVVVVGDSRHDIETAKQAGVISIGVLTGVEDKEGLKDADYIINNLEEIRIKEV